MNEMMEASADSRWKSNSIMTRSIMMMVVKRINMENRRTSMLMVVVERANKSIEFDRLFRV